jgi:hypothetical protein
MQTNATGKKFHFSLCWSQIPNYRFENQKPNMKFETKRNSARTEPPNRNSVGNDGKNGPLSGYF